jgi:CDP-diacylglycerol--serine O-phosphatidyltransferase
MNENKKSFEVVSNKNPRAILPNTLTIIGVCIGLSSIKFALDQNYGLSIIALLISGILDTLDGRIARLIKGTSKVGKELDSLTDVVSFGVAPAFIMYFWTLNELGKLGWLIVLVYVVCCALRLARFNIMTYDDELLWKQNFFEGVPSPGGAGLVMLPLILYKLEIYNFDQYRLLVVSTIFIITSILMISKLPTYSFKRIAIPRSTTIFLLFGIGLYFGLVFVYTFEVLFITGAVYLCTIPISYLHFRKIKNKEKILKRVEDIDETEDVL